MATATVIPTCPNCRAVDPKAAETEYRCQTCGVRWGKVSGHVLNVDEVEDAEGHTVRVWPKDWPTAVHK